MDGRAGRLISAQIKGKLGSHTSCQQRYGIIYECALHPKWDSVLWEVNVPIPSIQNSHDAPLSLSPKFVRISQMFPNISLRHSDPSMIMAIVDLGRVDLMTLGGVGGST